MKKLPGICLIYGAWLLGISFLFLAASCKEKAAAINNSGAIPPLILWAWEKPENLKFINDEKIGVAFLSQTLLLNGDEVILRPRRQPLEVNENTYLIAVTRIESERGKGKSLSDAQRAKLIELILKTLALKNVKAIQIDFDVVESERESYRKLITELRPKMPEGMPLSITALASFCVGDNWFGDLGVDEAIPMIFRMGADGEKIKNYLVSGKDFIDPLCKRSYGIVTDEPFKMNFDRSRRIYFFKGGNRSWTKEDVENLWGLR